LATPGYRWLESPHPESAAARPPDYATGQQVTVYEDQQPVQPDGQDKSLRLACSGKVRHDGIYHRDWRIETTRRRPPRSGSAAAN